MYCRWRSSYHDGSVEIPLTSLTGAYPKSGSGQDGSVEIPLTSLTGAFPKSGSGQDGSVEIPLTSLTGASPKSGSGFPTSYVVALFVVSEFSYKRRGDCSLCWYWWNSLPSLFKRSFLINALMWNFREKILMTGVTVPFNINNVCSG
jgi:hypothetical protein